MLTQYVNVTLTFVFNLIRKFETGLLTYMYTFSFNLNWKKILKTNTAVRIRNRYMYTCIMYRNIFFENIIFFFLYYIWNEWNSVISLYFKKTTIGYKEEQIRAVLILFNAFKIFFFSFLSLSYKNLEKNVIIHRWFRHLILNWIGVGTNFSVGLNKISFPHKCFISGLTEILF